MNANERLTKAAKSPITSNIVGLVSAISTLEEDIKTVIVACEQEKLIISASKRNLLDGLTKLIVFRKLLVMFQHVWIPFFVFYLKGAFLLKT